MEFLQCTAKNTSVSVGIVEKKLKKWYFCRAKHNSVNACMRVSDNEKGKKVIV